MSTTRDGGDDQRPTVLILGGWSPGPLNLIKRNFYGICSFLEPSIPMPPMGCSWCLDIGMAMLAVMIGLTVWACVILDDFIKSRAWLAVARLAVIVTGLVLSRLCVAATVRGSMQKGVNIASRILREQNVAVVIGFSWGGGVLAEMLRLGLVGGPDEPAVLLIAPTTVIMASFAMRTDAPLTIRIPDSASQRVHVCHGTYDESFCPHSERWGLTGATFHLIRDNHVFCRQESVRELSNVLATLLRTHEEPPAERML